MKTKIKKKAKSDHKKAPDQQLDKNGGRNSLPSVRRASMRLQSLQKLTPSSKNQGLVDSAYDADEESVTPNSSPDQKPPVNKDPYEMDMTDDIPVVKVKQRRKNNTKKVGKQIPAKKSKKVEMSPIINAKKIPTSTPVLHSSSSSPQVQGDNSLSATPEVTPILPYKPHESASASDSFATPQIHRPSRKRSLQPEPTVNLSTDVSYSSHADSGISLSPLIKKSRVVADSGNKLISQLQPQSPKLQKVNSCHTNKEENTFPSLDPDKMHKKINFASQMKVIGKCSKEQICNKSKPDKRKKEQIHIKNAEQDSCFGFDSYDSAEFASENSPPVKPLKEKRAKKSKKPVVSKDSYRTTHTSPSSDSSLTCLTNDKVVSSYNETSDESGPRLKSTSPTLFSDSFSADSESLELEVNKSSSKAYTKSSRVNKSLSKAYTKSYKVNQITTKAASKLDEWASNFNMEIEDIEKFDLNIE